MPRQNLRFSRSGPFTEKHNSARHERRSQSRLKYSVKFSPSTNALAQLRPRSNGRLLFIPFRDRDNSFGRRGRAMAYCVKARNFLWRYQFYRHENKRGDRRSGHRVTCELGVKGQLMARLLEMDQKPKWILVIADSDPRMREEQANALKPHARELRDRKILVLAISPTEVTVLHGECRCVANARDIAKAYKLSFVRFSSSLVDEYDCVKWAAPVPVSFSDLMTVIDEMPHHDAENATRGPSL